MNEAWKLEANYHALVENINDVIFSLDAQGRFTYVSPAIERFAHYPVSQVIGQPFERFVHPDDLPGLQASFERTLTGDLEPYEFRVFARDGAVLHVRTSSRPLWENEQLVGLTGVMTNITEQVQAEQALRKAHAEMEQRVEERTAELVQANRMLSILSACSQVVVRATEEPALLQEICRIIVDLGGYPLVWIGYAEQDAAQTVRPMAQMGFEDGYLSAVNITWADTQRGRGPTGAAIRSGQPCIARDIQTDPHFAPWREDAIRRGYASSIALPLCGDDRVFGALNIYAAVPDAFHPEEVRLLMELANDLAFGVTSLRERAARNWAEEALRESEMRYRAIVEAFDGLIYVCSPDYRVEFMNKQLLERTGYDGTGELCYKVLHDRDSICLWCVNNQVFAGETVRWEVQSPKDNHWYYVVNTPIYHADGSISKQAMILDITERKRVEGIMQARLRLLEFASSHSTDELLTAALDEIEALTGSSIGFYHFLEADQRTLSLQNWSTNTMKNMCTAEGKGSHYDVAQAGVWVDCVHERRPVIHNDYASLPHRKEMPKGHAPVIREVVVPIFRGDLITAIIGVGNKAADYNESDVEIVSQLGDLSWDIVERKRAEEALKEQFATLRGIIDSTDALIFSVDRQYRYTSFNQGHAAVMKALYGAEIETGHSLLDYMTVTEDRETARGNLDRALAGEHLVEEAYSGEELLSRRYFRVSHSPIKTEAGKAIGVAVLAQDMTERKRAEEALQEREHFLDSIFTSIQDGISVLDRDMNIIRVNPTMEEWYAHALPLVGKKCYEVYHSRSERCEICPTWQTLQTDQAA